MSRITGLFMVCMIFSGCGASNSYLTNRTSTVEYYRIFDVQTRASPSAMAKAASDGLARNVNDMQTAMPIPSSGAIPTVAGRFTLSNPLKGTALAALAGGAGNLGFRIASCDGAVWTATANRIIQNSNSVQLTVCLFRYTGGYHLDMYAVFSKQEGGLLQLSRSMAYAMTGTPEQWTEKTMLDVARSLRATGATVTLLEAQPDIAGTPWLDALDSK